MVGETILEGGSLIKRAVGECPDVSAKLGDVDVRCLIDTGAEVSSYLELLQEKSISGL